MVEENKNLIELAEKIKNQVSNIKVPKTMSSLQGLFPKRQSNNNSLFNLEEGKNTKISPNCFQEYIFNEAVYSRLISFYCSENKYPELEVEVKLKETGEWKSYTLEQRKNINEGSYITIYNVITAIRIKSTKHRKSEFLNKILVYGIRFLRYEQECEKINDCIDEYNDITSNLNSFNNHFEQLEPTT